MPDTSFDSLNRNQISELKFHHQIGKAIRKGKLIEIRVAKNFFEKRGDSYYTLPPEEREYDVLFVDPALLQYQQIMHGNNYMETEEPVGYDIDRIISVITTTALHSIYDKTVEHRIYEMLHLNTYQRDLQKSLTIFKEVLKESSTDAVYQMIVDADPTPNKEYVQWIMRLYVRVLKDRDTRTKAVDINDEGNQMGSPAFRFFEDLSKLQESIRVFHKIKNSKLINDDQKDIYKYTALDDFINVVFAAVDENTTEINYDVLTNQELAIINSGQGVLLYQDNDWIIVHTKTKEANDVFGKDTTWCTAGTRWGSMFDNYNSQGHLFVLIRNKAGSQSHLRQHPENRLQFHFETNQFMDALDKGIRLREFFVLYPAVKGYFRSYMVNYIMKKYRKMDDIIKRLTEYDLVKELIPILKENKTEVLELTNISSHNLDVEFKDLGEITTLKELTLKDSDLTRIPESISKLKNLRALRLQGNNLTEIPEWINKLTSLETLNVRNNKIAKRFDISQLTKLKELLMDSNKQLTELPTGLGNLTELTSIDFAYCNIKEIPEEILQCKKLKLLTAARNRSLTKIPTQIVNLPEMLYIAIDDTAISRAKIMEMENTKANPNTKII